MSCWRRCVLESMLVLDCILIVLIAVFNYVRLDLEMVFYMNPDFSLYIALNINSSFYFIIKSFRINAINIINIKSLVMTLKTSKYCKI